MFEIKDSAAEALRKVYAEIGEDTLHIRVSAVIQEDGSILFELFDIQDAPHIKYKDIEIELNGIKVSMAKGLVKFFDNFYLDFKSTAPGKKPVFTFFRREDV